ncbi:centrosomal protein of 55 kDa isoform X2 [Petromyzon marinus]|uniref:Centrosomal protein of 55 kDa isoform X2 n=1 Tax=Petromyzon marinus TaxID=7757 RepID=A0AAJ7WS02_PETMA|nr:centrosomal protein of 55 kDa isoform X2 [Petromyzon marinus]
MSSGKTTEKGAGVTKRVAPLAPGGNAKGILPGQGRPVPANRSPSKPHPSCSSSSMDLLQKENAAMKKTIVDMNKAKGKMMDPERNALLQKILSLETLKVKQEQQLSEKAAETTRLRGEVALLHDAKLKDQRGEANHQEAVIRSQRQQVEVLGQQLETMTRRCQAAAMEGGIIKPNAPVDMEGVEERLNDALEKNRRWLVYDNQREAYVCGLHMRISQLEQQLAEMLNNAQGTVTEEKQGHFDRLLLRARTDLDGQRAARARAESELELARQQQETEREAATEARAELERERQQWEAERSAHDGEREQTALLKQRLEGEKGNVGRLQAELSLVRQRFEAEQSACGRLRAELGQLHKRIESEVKQAEVALEWERRRLLEVTASLDAEKKRVAELSARLKSEQEAARGREEERRRAEAVARKGDSERKRAEEERRAAEEERRRMAETALGLKNELERYRALYEEKFQNAADYCAQVQLLKKVLNQRDKEDARLALLEEEVRSGQGDRIRLEGGLNKVLRELRRARDRSRHLEAEIASLPKGLRNLCQVEQPCHPHLDDDDIPQLLTREPRQSPRDLRAVRHSNSDLLEESLLECPNCSAEYPVSRHRDLLNHLDICCQ